jgi:hypothetical protein
MYGIKDASHDLGKPRKNLSRPRLPGSPLAKNEPKSTYQPRNKKGKKYKMSQCIKCKYHGVSSNLGYSTVIGKDPKTGKDIVGFVYCNFCGITGNTCMRHNPDDVHGYIDIRGDGPDCKLYEKGEMMHDGQASV